MKTPLGLLSTGYCLQLSPMLVKEDDVKEKTSRGALWGNPTLHYKSAVFTFRAARADSFLSSLSVILLCYENEIG